MEIYISYAKEDEAYGQRFKNLLKPSAKNFGFTTWSKQDTLSGQQWQKEMAVHLKEARLFVPLISADFFSSDRCFAEMTAALRLEQGGHIRIMGVSLRLAYLEDSPFANTPLLPEQGKPVTTWRNQDEAWLRVQSGILAVIKGMQIR